MAQRNNTKRGYITLTSFQKSFLGTVSDVWICTDFYFNVAKATPKWNNILSFLIYFFIFKKLIDVTSSGSNLKLFHNFLQFITGNLKSLNSIL